MTTFSMPRRIGVLSDTHLPKGEHGLPAVMLRAFEGVDAILHGGDVTQLDVLAPLSHLAPVYVVGGNNDLDEVGARCGYRRALSWCGFRLGLIHGDSGRGRTTPERARLAFKVAPPRYEEIAVRESPAPPRPASPVPVPSLRPHGESIRAPGKGPFDAIVFGHSHVPHCEIKDGVLMLNPGSPTERRREPRASYALLDIDETGLHATMHYL